MKRLVLASAALALFVAPAVAAAAGGARGAPAFHDMQTFAGVDSNFCGSGKTVLVSGRANVSVWVGETGGDPTQELRVVFSFAATLTNPANGAEVVDSGAGSIFNEIVAGTEAGPHTHTFVENGLRAKLRLANGGVLTHDAGSLTYAVSFDAADNFVGLQVLAVHGPHPAFESDVWCAAAMGALGL